jgi:hypothetical protein
MPVPLRPNDRWSMDFVADTFGALRRLRILANRTRVERIWRREGLKVPQKQPKRGRLWLNDGSCIRLRLSIRGTSGHTTSSRVARMMVASSAS